jgi:predicted methyltransferase
MSRLLALALCCALLGCASAPEPSATSPMPNLAPGASLDAALAGDWRRPQDVLRDRFRHPGQTLAFFGVQPDHTVIEITPGGGWYADILAPYLRARGHYIGAQPAAAADSAGGKRNAALREQFAGNTSVYGDAELRGFDPAAPVFGPAASADAVLTFRNVHNWVSAGNAEAYFKAFFDVLKPGGTLGVVDHRAKQGSTLEAMKKSGYLTETLVIDLAQQAGFQLVAGSEVNANPLDTTDHPNGVWTLPPTNRHDPADDAKYQAIGESDRMTLRFRKPG